ncbi:MAG: electron transfer flavoprotein subunit alpha/FixB family protein [Acidobacteria bacterium]|nr:MAG: electron transfer flavoprotein subunit alpha/FixB family protein [Acidobacteriota bacterium]
MNPILVVTEQKITAPGKFNPATWEVIAAAQQLGATLGATVVAAVLEAGDSGMAAECATRQLERVLHGQHALLAAYAPDVWVQTLEQIITQVQPSFVLLPHTYQVRDYAPQLATRMGAALISDVTGFGFEAGEPRFIRPTFQGKWAAEVGFARGDSADVKPGFVTVQIGAFRGDQAAMGAAAARVDAVTVTPQPSRLQAGEIFQEAKHAVDLTQAPIIVSVGRGIKEPKNLDMMRELAAALGGELAASRPICDAGWLPMDRQIGSSGQTVAPKLYLAVGISGAIQHLVGMKGSRTIAAINKDPEAPIFEVADYAVVGNLFDVVPALIAALKESPA